MGSMKDALLKAGLSATKSQNHRESAKGRERAQSEKHQQTRDFCEECNSVQPDVERYRHKNPTTEAEWICVACVDRFMIGDQFRVTQQSDFAKRGMFRREYGETRDLNSAKEAGRERRPVNKRENGNRDNRSSQNRKRQTNNNGNR